MATVQAFLFKHRKIIFFFWKTCIKNWTHYYIQKVHKWALKTVLDTTTRQSKFSQAYFLIYIQLHIL